MSTLATPCIPASLTTIFQAVPMANSEKINYPEDACGTARSRSTSAGTSNSRSSINTEQYSAQAHGDVVSLWARFHDSLKSAHLELADVPCDENELTALLGELGFTAVERARLRRECRARQNKTASQAATGKAYSKEKTKEHIGEIQVNDAVFLTGDFFGDDVSVMVGSVVAAGLESPSAQISASAADIKLDLQSTVEQQMGENVFLTGDFFGDDLNVALLPSPVPTVNPVMESRCFIPPPPLAPPLVHIQPEMQLTPPPTQAPDLDYGSPFQLTPAMPLPEPMQQAVLGSPQLHKPHSGLQEFPSMGSSEHHMGTCKPCAYFGERGCENGSQCQYCHLCPPGELKRRQKIRRSAQRRMRFMNASEFAISD